MEYKVNNISYKYTTDGPQVLKNVSFSIEQGKVTAIVGPSGCGKSTLVQIFSQVIPKLIGNGELEGSFDVPEGTFVSVVSQNPENQLFGYGVEDAIAFGLENIGMPQAEIVERMEYVLDLLKLQYLRKRSVDNLSGGQRQRISIARAILKNPPILILDEATSALDTESERLVQEALERLMKTRTTIAIAHRLSTIKNADEICVLYEGEIVERGKHEELLEKNGYYKRLNDMQSLS